MGLKIGKTAEMGMAITKLAIAVGRKAVERRSSRFGEKITSLVAGSVFLETTMSPKALPAVALRKKEMPIAEKYDGHKGVTSDGGARSQLRSEQCASLRRESCTNSQKLISDHFPA